MSDERRNPSPEYLYERKWRIFGVMMVAWAMTLLDVSIVNIAIPELQQELSTDVATVTWVINPMLVGDVRCAMTSSRSSWSRWAGWPTSSDASASSCSG